MLSTLRIRNLALVTDLTVEFRAGLNIITGETGAGKSILLGALNLVLGARADRTLIRSGADHCSVEAVFDVRNLRFPLGPFLEENGLEPCEDHQLVVKRSFTQAGANRQFINGSPTTLQILATLGDELVDMHGPHDHQTLLHTARQLGFLDAFGKLEDLQAEFRDLLLQHRALEKAKQDLVMDEQAYAQQLDLLRFQTHEIASAKLEPAEEETLQEQYDRTHNASRLLQLAQTAQNLIDGEEDTLASRLGLLGRTLLELQRLDAGVAPLVERQTQLTDSLQELATDLSHYLDRIELDPEQLQTLEERLNLIQSLRRKYGRTVPEIILFGEEARQRLQALEQRETELERLHAEQEKLEVQLWKCGQRLTKERQKTIPKLAKQVSRHLEDLGFQQCRFDISLQPLSKSTSPAQLTPSGLDIIEFLFSPNPGEPTRPLRSIASSGEMARVMLALKTVLAAEDQVPVLVFDEVDANIGGEIAHAVGEKMRQIAGQRQVFCITHLAQVAAFSQAHYLVQKEVTQGRTQTRISRLTDSDRVEELSRMLGGRSEAARRLARDIIKKD